MNLNDQNKRKRLNWYELEKMFFEWLAQKKPSETVYMVGPLGNSFSLEHGSQNLLFVAGGMGIVPILAFARSFLEVQNPPQMTLLYGAKNAGEHLAVYCQSPRFSRYWEPYSVTEDGSTRYKGLVTDFLPEFLDKEPDQIFACGPRGMLAKMAEIIEPSNIPCQVALETYMGCGGQGRCFGCAVPKRKGGYSLLCKDGPVFDIREVVLDG